LSLLDVQRNRINKINDITSLRQGKSIGTSTAANIQNQCWRSWQEAIQEIQRPNFFPSREWAL
jgi:chorismate synthase